MLGAHALLDVDQGLWHVQTPQFPRIDHEVLFVQLGLVQKPRHILVVLSVVLRGVFDQRWVAVALSQDAVRLLAAALVLRRIFLRLAGLLAAIKLSLGRIHRGLSFLLAGQASLAHTSLVKTLVQQFAPDIIELCGKSQTSVRRGFVA